MTQAELKTTLDRAFGAEIDRLFGVFVSNLLTEEEQTAIEQFRKGLDVSLRAHAITISIAEGKK